VPSGGIGSSTTGSDAAGAVRTLTFVPEFAVRDPELADPNLGGAGASVADPVTRACAPLRPARRPWELRWSARTIMVVKTTTTPIYSHSHHDMVVPLLEN
jgi:hypothetical protein